MVIYKKILLWIFLLVICLTINSCFKQSAPTDKNKDNSASGKFDIASCNEVSLLSNILKHDNILNLFRCLGWKKELPSLYRAIEKTNEIEWNFLTTPPEDFFLDQKSRRDRLLNEIIILNNNNALEGVSNIAESIFGSGIINSIAKIFNCSENPADIECDQQNKISKENVLGSLQSLQLQKSTYKQIEQLFKNLVKDFENNPELLKNIYREIVDKKFNKSLLAQVIGSYADLAIQGELTETDALFIRDVLSKVSKGDSDPWIYSWLNKMSEKGLLDNFLEVVFIDKFKHFDHVQNLYQSTNDDMICNASDGVGRQVYIDIKATLNNLLNNLRTNTYDEFTKKLILQVNFVKTSQEFCPLIKKWPKKILKIKDNKAEYVTHSLNFYEHLKDFTDILAYKENWEIFKFLTTVAYNVTIEIGGNKSTTEFEGEVTYLLKLMSSRPNLLLVEVLRNSILPDRKLYKYLSQLINRISPEQYKIASSLAKKLIDINRESKDFALVLNNISDKDKEKIFVLTDKVFSRPNDILHYLNFFSEIVSEFKNDGPDDFISYFQNNESRDLLYLSLKNLTSNLNDQEVQSDLKKFVSKDYILKTVKILSSGVALKKLVENTEKEKIALYDNEKSSVNLELGAGNENSIDAEANIKCLKMMLVEDYGLHALIKTPIKECEDVKEFSATMLKDFSIFSKDYHNFYFSNDYTKSLGHIFDKDGLFSPELLAVIISNLKSLDESLSMGSYGVRMTDYLDELADLLLQKNNSTKCQKCLNGLALLNSALGNFYDLYFYIKNDFSKKFEKYRNSMLSEFSSDYKNLDDLTRSFKMAFSLFFKYGDYIERHSDWVPEVENQKTSCRSWNNFNIGVDPCPGKSKIKSSLNYITELVLRDNNRDGKNALYYFLEATHSQYGIQIPFDYSKQYRYKLSLAETLQMLFDQSDKKFIGTIDGKKYLINKWPIYYRNEDEEKDAPNIYKTMTTIDRIEVTIRDINFDSNYLGANYENTVSKGLDYNYVVKKNKNLLNICTKFRFCGHTLSSDEKRLVKNALSSYDGLLHSSSIFGHASYMQGLVSIFVASSLKTAQVDSIVKVRLGVRSFEIPKFPSFESLKFHNGKLLYEVASLAGFNNAARFINSRIGTNKVTVDKFLHSFEMKAISDSLLRGYDFLRTKVALEKILRISNMRIGGRNSIIDDLVDYFYDLKYEDQRFIETSLFDLSFIHTFMGAPSDLKVGKFFHNKYFTLQEAENEFKGNNLLLLIENIDKILEKYPVIKESFSAFELIKIFKFFNRPIKFVKNNLSAISTDEYYETYYLLNKCVKAVNQILFTPYFGITGFSLLTDIFDSRDILKKFFTTAFEFIKFGNRIENSYARVELTDFYRKHATRALSILNSASVSFSKLMNYFHQSTSRQLCGETNVFECKANYHYDEPFRLLVILSTPSVDRRYSKLESALYEILEQYSQQFKSFIDDVLNLTKLNIAKPVK